VSVVRARHFHNQPADSPLDRWLGALWREVRALTDGRLDVRVCPEHDGIPGGDPEALTMLLAGEVEFGTFMGGLLGRVAPTCEVTGLPFVFDTEGDVHRALAGPLAAYLGQELAARGLRLIPGACFENGFRHISTATRPIRTGDDLVDLRIRTPAGRMFVDFFETLGARPVPVNLNRLYAALRDGTVEAQENPLVMVEVHRLWEVQTFLSLTGHMWSGFHLVANVERWEALPGEARRVVEAVARRVAAAQRRETVRANAALATGLAARGLVVNTADTTGMRRRLGGFYARWRRELGARAWALLEAVVGPVG